MISAVTSVGMVIIWLIYLQLFYIQYKRNNRPCLVIHHAQGNDPAASCLFVNMGKEPVHVQCVIARIRMGQRYILRYITDYHRITPQEVNVQAKLRQGPVQPGGYLVLGSFEEIILGHRSDAENNTGSKSLLSDLQGIKSLELRIAVIHGPSKFHIGARRRFIVEHKKEKVLIRAINIFTEQLVSWRKRKVVREWIETRVEPSLSGGYQTQYTSQGGNTADNKRSTTKNPEG